MRRKKNYMKQKQLTINYTEYTDLNQLPDDEQQLIIKAVEALNTSYSPYSQFKVGAAIQLASGNIVIGSNQENSVSPVCICAERVAIFNAKVTYPDDIIEKIAITASTQNFEIENPVTPCGSCRQVMVEAVNRQKGKEFKIILHSPNNRILVFNSVNDMLPFNFNEKRLQNV
ncbi:cytidine deaminase [Odoribacter sp. OttesenSCG-928-L07]|nr:cytidine deaminase [Odoribacter sp. OttesenSCG-928-L07]MDL2238958.1 cytidine deaminase [Bacteroidales bacterium OttesenSCG-928-L14]